MPPACILRSMDPSALRVIQAEHQALAAMLRSLVMLIERSRDTSQPPPFGVMRAMLFYIDFFKKVPFPDQKMLEFLMIKVGVPENLRSQFSVKLREFNANALADFANL